MIDQHQMNTTCLLTSVHLSNTKEQRAHNTVTRAGNNYENDEILQSRGDNVMMYSSSKKMAKYWQYRFNLFSKFDDGIATDEQGLYSVTPRCWQSTRRPGASRGPWCWTGSRG